MPYITHELRDEIRPDLEPLLALVRCGITDVGVLNYILTMIANEYWLNNGQNYRAINNVIGAFECAKHEFTRRVVVPYEERKRKNNGDVYRPY